MEYTPETNLRAEQIFKVREKITIYHNMLAQDLMTLEKHESDLVNILNLGKMIREKYALDPRQLVFWHVLIGSTLGADGYIESEMELDAPEGDIACFVDELLENK